MINKTFAGLLEYFVLTYARKEAGLSGETLRSYYTSLEQYIFWLEKTENVTTAEIDASYFNTERIRGFLLYIENEQGVSVSTRNQRRAGIVAFLEFATKVYPVYTRVYLDAKDVKVKKVSKPEKSFLSIEEYKSLLDCVDITRRNGFSHFLLISIMYDSAARVDEAVRMNLEDFSFGVENSVIIFGKGSKYRRIYLTSHSVKLVKEYMHRFTRDSGALFLNRSQGRITDAGIDYILKKYAALASQNTASLKYKVVSPHVLRRSKATHMLLNGASLPVIQRFLGHESIKTTESYLEIGSDAMTKAVLDAEKNLIASGIKPIMVSSWKDPDVLKRLKKLAK